VHTPSKFTKVKGNLLSRNTSLPILKVSMGKPEPKPIITDTLHLRKISFEQMPRRSRLTPSKFNADVLKETRKQMGTTTGTTVSSTSNNAN
jgi:hypothetical protein